MRVLRRSETRCSARADVDEFPELYGRYTGCPDLALPQDAGFQIAHLSEAFCLYPRRRP